MTDHPDSSHSAFREKTLEHLFIGEVLRRLGLKGVRDAEVLFDFFSALKRRPAFAQGFGGQGGHIHVLGSRHARPAVAGLSLGEAARSGCFTHAAFVIGSV